MTQGEWWLILVLFLASLAYGSLWLAVRWRLVPPVRLQQGTVAFVLTWVVLVLVGLVMHLSRG